MPGNYSKLVTVVAGQTITASERNNEFDNVINNMTPDGVDDASANVAAMQATVDPAGGSLATSLRGELQRMRFQLLKLGSASGNWYDALPFLAGITPAAAGATGTDLNNRLAQMASQIKNLGGLTNWYDTITAALLKAGGTMAGPIAMGGSKVTGLGAATTAGDALRYEQLLGLYLLLTGGTMSGAIAMGANKITGLAAATANGDAARFEQLNLNAAGYIKGTVVQTVQYIDTAATSSSGTTWTITTTAATITPLATTHKIRVSITGPLQNTNSTASFARAGIFRGATDLSAGLGFGQIFSGSSANTQTPCAMTILDSPASVSAIIYSCKIISGVAATGIWNNNGANAIILLEEIAF